MTVKCMVVVADTAVFAVMNLSVVVTVFLTFLEVRLNAFLYFVDARSDISLLTILFFLHALSIFTNS